MKSTLYHLRLLGTRLGLVLLVYFLCRVIFLLFNFVHFQSTALSTAFLGGLRFDLSAIALINSPFILLSLVPGPWLRSKSYQRFLLILLVLLNLPGLMLNLMDTEYFKFISKRSTADLFDLLLLNDDMVTLAPSFIKDYWYLFVILLVFIGCSVWAIKRVKLTDLPSHRIHYLGMTLALIISSGLALLAIRGGTQLRPIDGMSAMAYGRPEDVPLIINTPFSIMRSWGKDQLDRKSYFDEAELERIYSPVHHTEPHEETKQNVVLIILESFTKEYVGNVNESGIPYTPFLDSLMTIGTSFEHSYANGRKSIEALPSILAGIPALSDQPFITSSYSGQALDAIPRILAPHGYSSSFYHGGQTGTMGFDKFCLSAGFDRYVGREDYPDPKDYDGNWGIYDGPFFRFFAKELISMKEPFFSTLFSLSSHHPYVIPEEELPRYTGFEEGLGRSIRYTDDVLREFFDIMSHDPLFTRTLFVITADHTPNTTNTEFLSPLGSFSVPIIFYDPSRPIIPTCTVAQHADIQSTVINLLGVETGFVGFGKSLTGDEGNWSLQFINGFYQLREDSLFIRYDGVDYVETTNLNSPETPLTPADEQRMLRRIQAMIQQFNDRMIENRLTYAH